MRILRPIIVAFSMFSRIPMPRIEWDEGSMRYAFAAFPLVGGVIALVLGAWRYVAGALGVSDWFYAAIAVALPVLLTGGIHLDGYCDVVDALSSQADREKKLDILKDPRIGAFAAIYVGLYLLLLFAAQASLRQGEGLLPLYAAIFIASRALGAVLTLALPNARTGGLAHAFSQSAQRTPVYIALGLWLALSCGLLLLAPWGLAAGCALGILATALWFIRLAKRKFGGITGDLAGFFIQMCELTAMGGAYAGMMIVRTVFVQ